MTILLSVLAVAAVYVVVAGAVYQHAYPGPLVLPARQQVPEYAGEMSGVERYRHHMDQSYREVFAEQAHATSCARARTLAALWPLCLLGRASYAAGRGLFDIGRGLA